MSKGSAGAPKRRRVSEPASRPKKSSEPRPTTRARRPQRSTGAIISWIVALCSIAFVSYVAVWLVTPHAGRRGAVRVSLSERPTADEVALALFRAGAIDRPWLFSWAMTLTGTADHVPRRVLLLRDDVAPRTLLRAIASGGALVRVTIPEGYSRFEIAQRLAREGVVSSEDAFIAATEARPLLDRLQIQGDSCEGYLFPDTYDLYPESAADEVVERMVRNFRRRWDEARRAHPATDPRMTALSLDDRSLLTLASLVEEEAGTNEDRPRIASVFFNRLTSASFTPRLLQSDPTVVYGCRVAHPPSCADAPRTGRFTITRSMLDDSANPFSTYRREGLPPGPITNPGRASIAAVLAPASTQALYFVAMGDGRSAFADSLAEHNANVQRYLRPRR